MYEYWERKAELLPIERSGWLPDDDGVKAALRISKGVEECGCLWPSLPREGSALPNIEELGYDLPTLRLNQCCGTAPLPLLGTGGVL
jgi:hypothetical protein